MRLKTYISRLQTINWYLENGKDDNMKELMLFEKNRCIKEQLRLSGWFDVTINGCDVLEI